MREHESRGMKRDPRVPIAGAKPRRRSIFQIAHDGKAPHRELNAELVASSGRRPQLELA
jgi:hypothetical protein